MFKTLPNPFASHFYQAKSGNRADIVSRVVLRQRFLQCLQYLRAMFGFFHIDKIENNDATQISEPQLPGNRDRGFKIGTEDRLLQIAMTNIAAGVDVYRRHRLGLIDHQVPSGF